MKFKKLISIIMAMSLVTSCMPYAAAEGLANYVNSGSASADSEETDFIYEENDDYEEGTLTIYKYVGEGGDVVIPAEIGGKKVIRIGKSAFKNCTTLTSVVIPHNITDIYGSAFEGCTSLISAEIPDSVEYMGDYVFWGCTSLTSVKTKNGITDLGQGTFFNCTSLTSIEIPSSITTIGSRLFSGCTSLTSITIPNSVTNIKSGAFRNCTSLTSITIPNSVTTIESEVFEGCTSLTSIDIPAGVTTVVNAFNGCTSLTSINVSEDNKNYSSLNGVLFNKDKTELLRYPEGKGKKEETYSIPNGVTTIGYHAFDGCSSLTSIDIPDSVTTIDYSAFSSTSLTSIYIPDSVTYIGGYAFSGTSLTSVDIPAGVADMDHSAFRNCTLLSAINVSENNKAYSSTDGVLFNKEKTELMTYPAGKKDESYNIPSSVEKVDDGAFEKSSYLISVDIPDSVTNLGMGTFGNCTNLASAIIRGKETMPWYTGNEYLTAQNAFYKTPDYLTIYGYKDSYAEMYANSDGKNFVAIDDTTAIQINNGVAVTVPEDSSATLSEKTLDVKQTGSTETSATFNISLKNKNGSEVQPGGSVEVKIPVPASLDGESCNVYRHETDGTYTDMKAEFNGGCMVFVTDHFSEYVISAEEPEPTEPIVTTTADKTPEATTIAAVKPEETASTAKPEETTAAAAKPEETASTAAKPEETTAADNSVSTAAPSTENGGGDKNVNTGSAASVYSVIAFIALGGIAAAAYSKKKR